MLKEILTSWSGNTAEAFAYPYRAARRWFIRVNSNSIGAAGAVRGEEQRRGILWGGGWIFLCNLPERFKNPGDPAIYLALCYAEPRQRKIDSVTASNPLLRPAPHHYGSTTQTPYRPLRPFPQPMRDDRGGHLGWRVIERKRWVRNLLWGCVLSAPLGLGRKKAEEGADGAWKLQGGSYKGLLALYWSIALPCFALLSWYKVQYPWRRDTRCEAECD